MKAKICRDADGLFWGIVIECPGCGSGAHVLPVNWLPTGETEQSPDAKPRPHWGFNGNFEKPTFQPSILSSYSTWAGTPQEKKHVCHSFVTDGKIQFLGDSTHDLAGQTVDLLDVPDYVGHTDR